jgi:hypothetical protein
MTPARVQARLQELDDVVGLLLQRRGTPSDVKLL